jgi:RNA polymerase sigma-70 factor, ECF subfamily
VDDRTLNAARSGDRAALASLLRELADPWFRMCLAMLGDRDAAADATQEAAARFLRELPRFRGTSSLKTWAIGIAVNVCREARRKRKPASGFPVELVAASEHDPEGAAMLADERVMLHAALADLPERQREAVLLRYFEDLSVEETAAAMNCAQGTIKATVFQALHSLREKLIRPLARRDV